MDLRRKASGGTMQQLSGSQLSGSCEQIVNGHFGRSRLRLRAIQRGTRLSDSRAAQKWCPVRRDRKNCDKTPAPFLAGSTKAVLEIEGCLAFNRIWIRTDDFYAICLLKKCCKVSFFCHAAEI